MPSNSHLATLDERSLAVLTAVVRLDLETGRPVSSGLVERSLQRAVSSATVRGVMKRLEAAGYLEQPHTSAGRRPTDAGYRVFVDHLLSGWALRRHDAPAGLQDQVRQGVRRAAGSQERLKLLAGLLSRLTHGLGIIAGPTLAEATVQRLECFRRGGGRVLMIVMLEDAAVRTGVVTLPDDPPEAVVAAAGRLLSRRVAGRTLREAAAGLPDAVDLEDTPVTRCAASTRARSSSMAWRRCWWPRSSRNRSRCALCSRSSSRRRACGARCRSWGSARTTASASGSARRIPSPRCAASP